jgi:hypothetical protein
MNLRYTLSAFSFALGVIALAAPSAFAATVDFSCSAGATMYETKADAKKSINECPGDTGVGPAPGTKFYSYSEGGFTVTPYDTVTAPNSQWAWGPDEGDAAPSIKSGGANGGLPDAGAISVTDGGGYFDFESVVINFGPKPSNDDSDLAATETYTFLGYANGALVFDPPSVTCGPTYNTTTGAIKGTTCKGGYQTVDSANSTVAINDLVIELSTSGLGTSAVGNAPDPDYTNLRIDDIDVTATPEPGTLLLLGSGLSALAFAVRRRMGA